MNQQTAPFRRTLVARPRLLAAVVVVVSLVAVGLFTLGALGGTSSGSPDAATGQTSEGPGSAEGRTVAAALGNLAADPDSLVAAASQTQVGDTARAAVPDGTEVRVEAESWSPAGDGWGTILVTLRPPDGPETTYLATMMLEQGTWKVLATIPVDRAAESRSAIPGGEAS